MDCRLPGFSVHGNLQARILEYVAMLSSRGSSQPGDGTCVSYLSCIIIVNSNCSLTFLSSRSIQEIKKKNDFGSSQTHCVIFHTWAQYYLIHICSAHLLVWELEISKLRASTVYHRFADKSRWSVGWQDSSFRAERVLYTNLAQGWETNIRRKLNYKFWDLLIFQIPQNMCQSPWEMK